LQCVAVCCSVLQCVAVRCSVWQISCVRPTPTYTVPRTHSLSHTHTHTHTVSWIYFRRLPYTSGVTRAGVCGSRNPRGVWQPYSNAGWPEVASQMASPAPPALLTPEVSTATRSTWLLYDRCVSHYTTHCSTLQHTATHCNTLQHTATHSTATWSTWLRHVWGPRLQTANFSNKNMDALCTARSVEDETRNAELHGNRNCEWWGDFSQLVKIEIDPY